MMITFPKIYPPFVRHTEGPNRNKLDKWNYFCDEFEVLAAAKWIWTEKIDGTNIRVFWDGHTVEFGGRTNNAQIPAPLFNYLRHHFTEGVFEQAFGSKQVYLFGEGCAPGIQSSGNYNNAPEFFLFDVAIPDANHNLGVWWLHWEQVTGIAKGIDIRTVPEVGQFGIATAVSSVEDGLTSHFGSFISEGLVGRAPAGILNRRGERIVTKVKTKDFND